MASLPSNRAESFMSVAVTGMPNATEKDSLSPEKTERFADAEMEGAV